jgi:hypothetical protein
LRTARPNILQTQKYTFCDSTSAQCPAWVFVRRLLKEASSRSGKLGVIVEPYGRNPASFWLQLRSRKGEPAGAKDPSVLLDGLPATSAATEDRLGLSANGERIQGLPAGAKD